MTDDYLEMTRRHERMHRRHYYIVWAVIWVQWALILYGLGHVWLVPPRLPMSVCVLCLVLLQLYAFRDMRAIRAGLRPVDCPRGTLPKA